MALVTDQPAQAVSIPLRETKVEGEIAIPDQALGLVLFAHGSGSSRHSPRNQLVARTLRANKIGTVLFDLLTTEEERQDAITAEFRFNIAFLAQRLVEATEWARRSSSQLSLGYFGSSTGAAAALVASTESQIAVSAIVSRGGRPDLAGPILPRVKPPTLLIVGSEDTAVVRMNKEAYNQMRCPKELRIVRGATHLFEEPGKLEQVAQTAAEWFARHLGKHRAR
jgi:putative phosphoribosyl transferase